MGPSCSIIIPVYNAFADTLECVRSVLLHSAEARQILLIDDASPEGELKDAIERDAISDSRLSVIRNQQNLGFVKSCNLGMQSFPGEDVVLLNSDTVVTRNWLTKLKRAAYSRPKVGTVTPFTNNGVVCSIPRWFEDNVIPPGQSVDSIAALVEKVSKSDYPLLPTCVGMCVYIRRELLDTVGFFDEETFGLGYGEENDLSLRGQKAGFVDLLDDSTFIFHRGSMSFKESKRALIEKNSAAIKRKYPHYFDSVQRFRSEDPFQEARIRVQDALVATYEAENPRRVLHIVPNGPHVSRRDEKLGGTELHVKDLISSVKGVTHWSLVPWRRCYYLTAHFPAGEREWVLPLTRFSLEDILKPEYFGLVHLHHIRFLDQEEACAALLKHGNYVVSFHDYALICPRFHLNTPTGKMCTGHECTSSCGYGEKYIRSYREGTKAVLRKARELICFSDSTRVLIESILDLKELAWKKQPHGIVNINPHPNQKFQGSAPEVLKVAFIGMLPQHKGSRIIAELIKRHALPSGKPVEWHVVGKLFLNVKEGQVAQHGEYKREELLSRLQTLSPDVIAILSTCPETYCLTLDEAWNARIPVIVGPLGAPPERVRESGAGWVLSELSAGAVIEVLDRISGNWSEWMEKAQALSNTRVISISEEGEFYDNHYQALCQKPADVDALFRALGQFALNRPPHYGLLRKAVGKVINRTIYTLDSLHVRGHLQQLAQAVLPDRFIASLKDSR